MPERRRPRRGGAGRYAVSAGAPGNDEIYGGWHSILDQIVGNEFSIARFEGVTAAQLNASLFVV